MAKFKLEDGTEVEAFSAEEVEAQISGLKAKVEELLGEKKTVSQKAKELEEAQALAEQERLKEKEEFKTLWEREQQSKKELQEKYETFSKQVQRKEIEIASTALASELTRDTKRAALLKEQIEKYARYSENGVTYEMGGVTVDRERVIDHIKSSFDFLIDGSQASGGGAAGSKSGGAAKKFNEYTPAELSEIHRNNPAEYERIKNNR